jgi:transcriptional regulator with XRE-family HTH domain
MPKLKPLPKRSTFAKRLRIARLAKGLSQKEMGIRAGIDEFSASSRANQWERDRHIPDLQMVERLAVVLEVPAPYFYARDEALAAWILAFPTLSAAAKSKLTKAGSKK